MQSKPQQHKQQIVRLIDRPEVTIAYLRHTGPYGAAVGAFWMQQVVPWMVQNKLMNAPRYGIGQDDPSATVPEQCRYDAGVEIQPDAEISGKHFKTRLPAGKYAALHFEGTSQQLDEAWRYVLHEWLPGSGMKIAAHACFEYYKPDAKYDPTTGAFECDICIPVVPL